MRSDKNKTILILGASRYYSKAIEAVKKTGFNVIAVDKNPESTGFKYADASEICDIIDVEGVKNIALKWNASAIIPVNDYGVPTAAKVSKILNLKGISPEAAERSTKKSIMRQVWSENGVACPQFKIVEDAGDLREAIECIGLPCILKPATGYGGASRGVIVISTEEEIDKAIEFTLSFYDDTTTLVEGFIDSVSEHSAEVLISDGIAHVITIGDKIKTPLPYRVDKNVLYPSSIPTTLLQKLKSEIAKAIAALGVNIGAAHIEFALDKKQNIIFFEMGARCGGGGTSAPIVPYVTGIDLFVELVRIMCGEKIDQLEPLKQDGCCYHFIIPKPGTISSIIGIDEMKKAENVLDAEFFYDAGQTIDNVTIGTERAGFIISGGKNQEDAYKNALKAESLLSIEMI